MSNGQSNNPSASVSKPTDASNSRDKPTSKLAFSLVVTMLGGLFVLTAALLLLPSYTAVDEKLLEYYKWALSLLVGAFGFKISSMPKNSLASAR